MNRDQFENLLTHAWTLLHSEELALRFYALGKIEMLIDTVVEVRTDIEILNDACFVKEIAESVNESLRNEKWAA